MSNYSEDQFEGASQGSNSAETVHHLKFTVDLLSVKDFKVAANLLLSYQINLHKTHSFKSSGNGTAIKAGAAEQKLTNSFASFEFRASKSQLLQIFGRNVMTVNVLHMERNG